MDLKDFVKETLIQISSGVKEAQNTVRELGGYANPAARVLPKESDQSHLTQIESGQNVFMIDFDVAINVSEEGETGAEAKLKVASFLNVGGSGKSGTSSSTTNRISFKVPLALPVDEVSKNRMLKSEEETAAEITAMNEANRVSQEWE